MAGIGLFVNLSPVDQKIVRNLMKAGCTFEGALKIGVAWKWIKL